MEVAISRVGLRGDSFQSGGAVGLQIRAPCWVHATIQLGILQRSELETTMRLREPLYMTNVSIVHLSSRTAPKVARPDV